MPFPRVYWKGLIIVLDVARVYITKHQLQLKKTLTSDQYNCLVDTLTAIISCLAILPSNTPTE